MPFRSDLSPLAPKHCPITIHQQHYRASGVMLPFMGDKIEESKRISSFKKFKKMHHSSFEGKLESTIAETKIKEVKKNFDTHEIPMEYRVSFSSFISKVVALH